MSDEYSHHVCLEYQQRKSFVLKCFYFIYLFIYLFIYFFFWGGGGALLMILVSHCKFKLLRLKKLSFGFLGKFLDINVI